MSKIYAEKTGGVTLLDICPIKKAKSWFLKWRHFGNLAQLAKNDIAGIPGIAGTAQLIAKNKDIV